MDRAPADPVAAAAEPEAPGPDTAETSGRRPGVVTVVVGAVALEALALVVACGVLIGAWVTGGVDSVGSAVALVVLGLGFAAILGGSARALLRRRRWARSPIVTWQLLQGLAAFTAAGQFSAAGALAAWCVVGLSAVVVVLLLTRPAVRWTTDGTESAEGAGSRGRSGIVR
ncbi:hypothetical protein CLV34_1711 [Luteimicrobium subarcticum]|uniref:Uncharacterized protein n=1 Tax=Luteimicrobium subarcticum TaxID=620910 RepID=A0A2M8WTE5_9MICO|nr:hypothetical protein CLV34_1711 [Luteimicrobium subarcticum]